MMNQFATGMPGGMGFGGMPGMGNPYGTNMNPMGMNMGMANPMMGGGFGANNYATSIP